ncbi:MAG: DUF2842 domain-containing protein [Acetobacteraceae bacterium]|nr:DUF2842 domain-containing protein [Acetobacteraceae bacterium]
MSRVPAATTAALLFVFVYVIAAVVLPDHLPMMPWPVEALYWCVAGLVWVFPVRWLMLWSVHKR